MEIQGKTIVLTGKFSQIDRKEAERLLTDMGARCSGSVSAKTDILFAGEKAGSKLAAATKHGAVDIRVGGMNETQIKARLNKLASHGFAVWYRKPGSDGWPSSGAPHIHAVFAGVKMKAELRGQVRDWLNGRNGLSSHTTYRFWTPTAAMKKIVELLFERNYTP